MDENGKLVLLSAGCGPGTCIILALDGQAESGTAGSNDEAADDNMTDNTTHSENPAAQQENSIPEMTGYSGTWGIAVGITFLGTVGDNGTFAVIRDD